MILAWTGDELSCRQAQNGVNFDFEVKFDLDGQGQSPPKTIQILTKVFYTYGPNLVILAWMGDELLCGQAGVDAHIRTHTQTDAGKDNTRRPKLASGKNAKCYVTLYNYIIFTFGWGCVVMRLLSSGKIKCWFKFPSVIIQKFCPQTKWCSYIDWKEFMYLSY